MEATEALWDEVRWAYLSSRKFAQVTTMRSAKISVPYLQQRLHSSDTQTDCLLLALLIEHKHHAITTS